jgi:hypothetical protein
MMSRVGQVRVCRSSSGGELKSQVELGSRDIYHVTYQVVEADVTVHAIRVTTCLLQRHGLYLPPSSQSCKGLSCDIYHVTYQVVEADDTG